jgi:hypothetical protein
LERESFGWDHAEAGAMLGRRWNLPAEFVEMVKDHTTTDLLDSPFRGNWAKVAVAMSALLPSVTDDVWHDAARFEELFVGLHLKGSPHAADVLAEVDTEFAEFAPVLKLPAPPKSLRECYVQSAAMV